MDLCTGFGVPGRRQRYIRCVAQAQAVQLTQNSGNFKMNGSVKMIKDIVQQLNDAKLDGSTGMSCLF